MTEHSPRYHVRPHPLIDELYPVAKWRRDTWQVYKNAEKTRGERQTATEMLLTNYEPTNLELWNLGETA